MELKKDPKDREAIYQLDRVINDNSSPALARARARLAIATAKLSTQAEASLGLAREVEDLVRPAIPDLVRALFCYLGCFFVPAQQKEQEGGEKGRAMGVLAVALVSLTKISDAATCMKIAG